MQKMMQKIENWVFYVFLFAIPISLRHIFDYQSFGYIEWQAKYLYATDILLGILLIFWIWNRSGGRSELTSPDLVKADYFLLGFVAVAGISIQNALDVGTAWFQFAKLIEGVLLYFYIKNYALNRFDMTAGFTALVAGGIFQAGIAIVQYGLQGSIGLQWLGESVFNNVMPGVAAFYAAGEKIVRVYGTTPHPNVLAAYFFIAIGAFYGRSMLRHVNGWWLLGYNLILWGLLLTYSRTIIGMAAIIFIAWSAMAGYLLFVRKTFVSREAAENSLKIIVSTVIVVGIFTAFNWPYVVNRLTISSNDEAVQLRMLYNRESLEADENLLGLGIGNFVPWLMTQDLHLQRNLYQPVHNIYLLIKAETGLVGLGLFLSFLALLWRDYYKRLGFKKLYHFSFALIVASILIFGLFDHFLWTIQAGRLMFWIALGLLAGAK